VIVAVFLYGAIRELLGLPGPWIRMWEGNWMQADARLASRRSAEDFEIRSWFRPGMTNDNGGDR
jgi:hypothetical protein